jgi:hypothetical protein
MQQAAAGCTPEEVRDVGLNYTTLCRLANLELAGGVLSHSSPGPSNTDCYETKFPKP